MAELHVPMKTHSPYRKKESWNTSKDSMPSSDHQSRMKATEESAGNSMPSLQKNSPNKTSFTERTGTMPMRNSP